MTNIAAMHGKDDGARADFHEPNEGIELSATGPPDDQTAGALPKP